jgi:hypothetical protein
MIHYGSNLHFPQQRRHNWWPLKELWEFSGTGTMVETYWWSAEGRQLIELPAKEIGSEEFRFASNLWPDRFLSLCEWGCNSESDLHCPTGRVFRVAPVEDEVFGMRQQAATLEEWLNAWLHNELYS